MRYNYFLKISFIPLLLIAVIASYFIFHPYKHTIIEDFSVPLVPRNGSTFGPHGAFTFSLDQNGTFVIDGKSKFAWERSDSYKDSAIIRSTKPLPKRYKISIVVGDIDYGLDKIDGLPNDPNFPEGPQNENGCYLLSITDVLPDLPHINRWWHKHRKLVIDVDNNTGGSGMPNPIFMAYFDEDNTLVTYDGDKRIWQKEWLSAIHYQENTFYKVEIEKTRTEYILRVFSENGRLLKEAKIDFDSVWHQDHVEYFVVGDPHSNYYQGDFKIKKIILQY